MIPVLATARLRLRPRTVDDADALFATFADPDLMRWWSHGPHASVAETRDRFTSTDDGDWRAWAITLNEDTAIGFVAAGAKRDGRVFEIGYMLARNYWGRGIASEAIAAVIDYLFDVEHARRVYADTDPDNAASIQLLERLGFQREGILRAEWETHIGVRDTLLLGLLPADRIRRPDQ